jgi:cephalosporin hydroxylase
LLERLVWQKDRVLLDDLVFRLELTKSDDWELGNECFGFYKSKELVEEYAKFLAWRKQFNPQNIFEIGIWDGGSMVFWHELFQPEKHVAIDRVLREDSKYFQRYVSRKGLESHIKSYWSVDQADSQRLREIVDKEFDGPLDLVIDDGSHLYGPTKDSFDTLFPLVRPGGFYIVEDWAWEHSEAFQTPDHPWAKEKSLTALVFRLVEATGSSPHLIQSLALFKGIVVVERGPASPAGLGDFELEHHISRRSEASPVEVGGQLGDDSSIRRPATKREASSRSVRLREELTMALAGWVRRIMGRTRGDEGAGRRSGYSSSGGRVVGELTATPNPVPAGPGQGTTTIDWSTGGDSEGQVYLRVGDEPEQLFAQAPRGSQGASFILAGPTYEFRLYSGTERERLLASVQVTRSDE